MKKVKIICSSCEGAGVQAGFSGIGVFCERCKGDGWVEAELFEGIKIRDDIETVVYFDEVENGIEEKAMTYQEFLEKLK